MIFKNFLKCPERKFFKKVFDHNPLPDHMGGKGGSGGSEES